MNDKSIEIIVAQFNKNKVVELIQTLNECIIPTGYEVSLTIITDAKRKLDAYKSAVSSRSKYKVYIDENVRINNKNILQEIVDIFQDRSISLITNIGAEIIPTDACLNINTKRIGKLDFSSCKFDMWLSHENISDVKVIDGYFFATQYDVAWSDDGFVSDEYIATVHGITLRKNGWRTVVAKDLGIGMTLSADDIITYNENDRQLFIEKYSLKIFPLVNILIPTYNRPDMLKIALDSALAQTYKNIEVIITDNGEHEDNANMLKTYFAGESRIRYYHNNGRGFGINENFRWLIDNTNPKAEYVSWLMDDDVLYPEKIELMVNYFLQYDDVTLVTSYRDLIDMDGHVMCGVGWNEPICKETSKYDGESIGRQMLLKMINFIGEPTTVLMKNDNNLPRDLGWSGDEDSFVIIDFPWWLDLMSKGSLIYIHEPQSAMRVHEIRDTNNKDTQVNVVICWLLDIRYAWNNRIYLKTDSDIDQALRNWLRCANNQVRKHQQVNYSSKRLDLLKRVMKSVEEALYNGYVLNFDVTIQ